MKKLAMSLATGALAVVMAGLAAAPASAIEVPQPDPAPVAAAAVASSVTYRVVLDRPVVTLAVPVTTTKRVDGGATGGLYCASVWNDVIPLGHACSTTPRVTVSVFVDAVGVKLGRSALYLVDEGAGRVVRATLDARRPSRFGVGLYEDLQDGGLFVRAPLMHYSPAARAWVPSKLSPVAVQIWTKRGWRTKATLTTNAQGVASGVVELGAGRFKLQLVRVDGATVLGAKGRVRTVTVTATLPPPLGY